jgi:hypothetical protein
MLHDFLGTVAKELQKTTVRFVMFFRLSLRMYHIDSKLIFGEISYLKFLLKFFHQFRYLLKWTKKHTLFMATVLGLHNRDNVCSLGYAMRPKKELL